ncbi:MAG: hypothetical protein AUH18_03690 [Candidatus Rokubacteria bacterium 13_2_20CM_69_10]|nr:MAG: hypothetical protein AUH18_03690 [Candidatus Rokubacteria bacterium 13_2_20CM_69_10]
MPEVFAVWAAAVKVTVVDGSAVPTVVYFAVSVRLDVLWPSASTVAVDGLNVSVMPLYVIVDDTAVRPL